MWIIPKNLPIYHSAQATQGLISDSKELSEQLEQSVMWRSKVSSSKTWLRRLKKDSSILHLFSQTLKPSLGNRLVEEWTSSVEGFLVNHLVPPAAEEEMKTRDTCGHTLSMESDDYSDLPLFSLKMSKESLAPNSKGSIGQTLKERQFCSMSIENWKGWVTKQRQAYSQRVKSVLPTNEKECLFLVSEMNSNKQGLIMSTDLLNQLEQNQEQSGRHLEEESNIGTNHQELRWATPMAGTKDHMGGSIEYYLLSPKIGKQVDLNGQVTLEKWTTPIARDCYEIEMNYQIPDRKDGKGRLDTMPRQIHHQEGYRGKLNPRWVEMLMGVPVGWTMPSCTNLVTIEQMNLECWEMESCPTQQQKPSSHCGEGWATPQARDWKGTQGRTNKEGKLTDLPSVPEGPWSTWPTPRSRDWKDSLNKVPPSINQTRSPTLGQALAEDLLQSSKIKQEEKLWSTPPASQRGETLNVYLSRMKDRFNRGFVEVFAPTLQVQVEAEEKGIDIKSEISSMKRKEGLLQKHQGAKETALILPEVYDHCILGIKDGLFVYSSTCIINTLYQEKVDAIKNGTLELYGDNTSVEESALDYALEMYYYNIEGAYEKDAPFFIYEDEEEENLDND